MTEKINDERIRALLAEHWQASDDGDYELEHAIYQEDAVLDYPQSGERLRGRETIKESRIRQPNEKRFKVRKITGTGNFWLTEYILSYDGAPSFVVSLMTFENDKVVHETQYFAEAFEPGDSRRDLVEKIDD